MLKKNTINRYDKYKDSGIEWIGEIPENWSFSKLSWSAQFINGFAFDSAQMDIDNQIPVIRIGDIQNGKVDYENCLKVNKDDNLEAYTVKLADIVIAMSGATTGKIATIDNEKKAYINQRVGIIRSKNNKFIKYCLENESFIKYINLLSAGSAQPNISMGNILDFKIPYISQREQETIAGYLDKKCGEIDRVVEVQKEVIEKLKEYKQSVITEAVTKGLDKSVPLKDSGIEWIGKIPQHWEIRRLKTVLNLRNEKAEYNGEIYIGLENVLSFLGKYNLTEDFVVEGISNKFYSGDLLFGKLRPYLAKATIVDFNGLCSSEFLVMQNFKGDNRYLLRLLLSYWFIDIVNSSTYGAKMPRASWDFISNMRIPFPSKIEQQQIADFLDKKCSEIDKIIDDKERLIEKLIEYKKSLIYECVTGKRKVAV